MNVDIYKWVEETGWDARLTTDRCAQLVLAFGDHPFFTQPQFYSQLQSFFPNAQILGCSSSGNIYQNVISDGDIAIATISFEKASIVVKHKVIEDSQSIESSIQSLIEEFEERHPKHVFVLADGLWLGGSQLTKALSALSIPVTGGLAGDADRFQESWVIANGPAKRNQIVLIGFYGELRISYGFSTGWREFGPERRVTHSVGSTVFEIDHLPALEIYTKYLGDLAADLPASGLRFPLSVRDEKSEYPYVRTLLGVDHSKQSLNFAGDVPQGSFCKFMKTDVDSLIDSSIQMAQDLTTTKESSHLLCLVVSCVGRRLVMGQISEEEIEAIQQIIGEKAIIFGFYSYGEIAPFGISLCSLHNQTTTLTLLSE